MTAVTGEQFGTMPCGAAVELFTLSSDFLTARVISLGCILTNIETKDKNGEAADIVLGFDTLQGYVDKHPYFGAVIGRFANRISKGQFTIDGKEYQLPINNGPNSIHGGLKGFDKALWTPEVLPNGVKFSLMSSDGEEGFPGEVKVQVTYTLVGGELTINYWAQTTKTTPINLTNHSYFNLAGHGSPNIYDHEVSVEATRYLPVDDVMIPTGEIASVENTPFDLRNPVLLGSHIQNKLKAGFDHNFCLQESKERFPCARVYHRPSGRLLQVETTQPGVQLYTANFLDGSLKGKGGAVYPKHSAFCLETQNWPDAVNKTNFPNALLRPGEEYNHTTWFTFSVL
uniref:Aldose 1-epimerase n=1 Tax=Callorhinchus milii TaxID=7868 RepID=A0A4W3H6E3_CALMI|eukprot:gi/632953686/ref/XP_007892559.1/ PREDICTED: aldose 1-epimerase [Callorhinchus milii]